MHDIFLIGGSPSSGSTLLVNLLNKHQDTLCLPETGLFVHGDNLVHRTIGTQEQEDKYELDLNSYLPWLSTEAKVSQAIGLNPGAYQKAIKDFPTSFDLLRAFVDPERKTFLVEKTPENVFAFYPYLADSPGNRVVLTIRDALSVTQSLFRRGFNTVESLLIWFGHSYETARLIRDFPSQVYQCTYDHLTRAPLKTVEEIIDFLGLDSGRRLEASRNQADMTEESASDSAYENAEMINFLVEYSSWNLAGTAWTKSPDAKVRHTEPVNLLGLDYLVLTEQLLFKTADDGYLSISSLEDYICGRKRSLMPTESPGTPPLRIAIHSELVRCLSECYPPFLTR